ncbi:SOS response-associated peptidase [Rhizobium sp.]
MCGRFALINSPDEVQEFLATLELEDFPARYNIAPTQPILAVIEAERPLPGSNQPMRRALLLRWGLIPGFVKDPREFPLLINARSETAIGKASFRAAMRHRRILIPASGFFEWWRPEKGSKEKSQAYWVRPKRGGIVAFAGLMETWASADGSEVDTGAILTADATDNFRHIHDRMPVVIAPEDFTRWLDCKTQEPRAVADLMVSPQADLFEAIPVSDLVNKVSNTGPELLDRVTEGLPPPPATRKAAGGTGGGQLDLF